MSILAPNNNLLISQSITKDLGLFVVDDQLYEMDFCPLKVRAKFIDENYPYNDESQPMMYGKYGETHLLGGSAKGSSQWTLPEKKRGGISVKQKRIDTQIDRMYGYMRALGVTWNNLNTQVPLLAKYKDNIWLRGEMDVFPTKVNGVLSIIDTKFTKTVHNYFSSVSEKHIRYSTLSCWGSSSDKNKSHECPSDISKNQPLMYHFLARNFSEIGLNAHIKFHPEYAHKYKYLFSQDFDYNETDFWFFVAGYDVPDISDELRHFDYKWNDRRSVLFRYMIDSAVERIRFCVDNDFKPNPKDHLCSGCALKDVCLK